MGKALVVVVAAVGLVGAGVLGIPATLSWGSGHPSQGSSTSAPSCAPASPVIVGTMTVPAGPVGGFCQPQLENAAEIIRAAQALGIGTHTQAIGVMTAIGESGLRNLDYGDAAGADSRGLFQQRANGAWGTLQDRMTPYIAATNFFTKLVSLPNWKSLSPTQAAHAVQANADPGYYSQYWPQAQAIVTALSTGP